MATQKGLTASQINRMVNSKNKGQISVKKNANGTYDFIDNTRSARAERARTSAANQKAKAPVSANKTNTTANNNNVGNGGILTDKNRRDKLKESMYAAGQRTTAASQKKYSGGGILTDKNRRQQLSNSLKEAGKKANGTGKKYDGRGFLQKKGVIK